MEVLHRYLDEAQQSRLLAQVKQFASIQARRDRAWISLLMLSGCRVGEFSRVTCAAARFALDSGWLFIPKEHRKGGKRDHQVPLTDPLRDEISTLLKIQIEMGGSGAGDEPLVLSRKHRGMSVRGFQDRFAHWCAQCGIKASPHWLRHTRAMNIMRRSSSNDPRGAVQGALGHADISSSGIYTRMSKEALLATLREVDGQRRVPKAQLRARFEGVVS